MLVRTVPRACARVLVAKLAATSLQLPGRPVITTDTLISGQPRHGQGRGACLAFYLFSNLEGCRCRQRSAASLQRRRFPVPPPDIALFSGEASPSFLTRGTSAD